MLMFSFSGTSKPLCQIFQMVVNHQKRQFQISIIDRIEKKSLSTYETSSALGQNATSAPAPLDQGANKSKSAVANKAVSSPEMSGMTAPSNYETQMRSLSRSAHVQSPSESTGSVTLRDLQADVPQPVPEVFENKGLKEFLSGQQRIATSSLVDPTTMQQVFYFDTMVCMKKLEAKGFSREQAEVCVECLVEIINSTLDHQAKHMITKSQQEIAVQQLLSEIISVKKDMVLLQKSEFSSLRSETEKIGIDMNRVETHFQDEVVKLKGQFSLDINLERGRAVEAHAENEKKLQLLHNKIDTEIANLKTTYEIYRNDVIKFAGGISKLWVEQRECKVQSRHGEHVSKAGH